jgi:hypothetical protein
MQMSRMTCRFRKGGSHHPQSVVRSSGAFESHLLLITALDTVYIEVLTPNGNKPRGAEAFITTRLVFGPDDEPAKIRKTVCEQMGVSMTSTFTYTISGDPKSKAEGFTTNEEIKKAAAALLARNRSARKIWNKAICVTYKVRMVHLV